MKATSEKSIHKAESPKLEQSSLGLSAFGFELKIGFDGKRATNNLTGLGNYSRSLIGQLAKKFPTNQYFIYTPKLKEPIVNTPLFSLPNVHLIEPEKGKSKTLWRSFGIKRQLLKDKIDLFHGLSHEIPAGLKKAKIKSIVTIHDLIFIRHPQYYKWIDRIIYKFKSHYACEKADRIIAISEKTKTDIVELYKINPSKIEVIYQSCDDSFKQSTLKSQQEIIREKYQLPAQYLLNVGTIEARKNLLLLIRAMPKINADYPLVVIGKETSYTISVRNEIEKLGLEKRVIFLNNVPFSDLPSIYQMASIFVLPSYYEGFGIPIIEALYSKVPVLAATGSCLEEAGGPNSLYFSPDNIEELAQSINQVLGDEKLQETMVQKGFEYVQQFNNEVVGPQLMDCYLKTLKR